LIRVHDIDGPLERLRLNYEYHRFGMRSRVKRFFR